MEKQAECLLSSFRGALEIKKLEDTQRALIARNMNKYADQKSFSRQRTVSLSSSVGSSSVSAIETPVANVGKIKPCGYLTLLDINTLLGSPTPVSSVMSDIEFVPNSCHQQSHVSRWNSFLKTTPKWILEMGIESLGTQRPSRGRKMQKESDKENFTGEGNSDSQLLQEKHDKENNVCNNNVQECTGENCEMEKEHETTEQENRTSVCTEDWRDWSLQLTEQDSLIITGKADKNVIKRSRDVSSCQRVDAHTLRLSDGTVYKLVGLPDHFTSLPYYVRDKFQCGFPDDWKEVKLVWEKYVKQGSLCSFSWPNTHLSKCRNISTAQKDKTVMETSSPVEAIECVEGPPCPLNSVVQSLCSDMSQVAAVDRVGEARSILMLEQENGKQLDADKTESCNQKLNSTVAQECGKETVVVGREAARVIQPGSVTVQEVVKKPNWKKLEVRLKRLTSSLVGKCSQQSDFMETEVSSKQLSDTALSLVEQAGTVPAIKMPSVVLPVNTDRPSSCDTSNLAGATLNTTLDSGEGSTLVNPHILHRWTPVLVARDKLKLVGYLNSTCSADLLHTTDVVACRKGFNCLKCHDGTFYRLQGSFADPQNNIPDPIREQLHEGVPHRWRIMIKKWFNLLPVVNGQEVGTELRQETIQPRASAASEVEHGGSADHSAGCGKLTDETVEPTAAVTSHNEHDITELSTASDENDSVSEAAVEDFTYWRGSVIPLRKLEGEGIIKESSRGRIVVPPVRYWLGERLVQQHNQPAIFCPRIGVQKVIVNQRVDSVQFPKKRKCSESESQRLSLSKRRCNEGKTKFTVPREKRRVLSNRTRFGQDRKVNTKGRKGRRVLEVDTNTKNRSRLMPKHQRSSTRICESYNPLSDAISVEAREGSRILRGKAQNCEGRVVSKSASSSQSLSKTGSRGKKCSAGIQKHRGLEDFKGGTLKQRGRVGLPFDVYDNEDELLSGRSTDNSGCNPGAYNPLSVQSAAPPMRCFMSVLGMEDKAYPPRPAPSPWQQQRQKERDRFVKRQQIMEGNTQQLFLETTTGAKADKFGTANEHINQLFTVQFDVVEDKASSFDEEDLSSSWFSTADSRK